MPRGGVLEHRRPRRSRPSDDAVEVLVGGSPVLAFVPQSGRILSCLVMPVIDRRVDVSVSPSTAVANLHHAADQHGVPHSRAEASTRHALERAVADAGAWSPRNAPDDTSLTARIGGAAFPLLGAAYDAGAAAIDEVPRWAAEILATTTARDGAREAFGAKATRPVVTALARSLSRTTGQPVDLSRLAFALVASEVLEPDTLARVLTFDGQTWPLDQLPEPQLLEDGREAAELWGASHTFTYLQEACAQDDGLSVLIDCITYATDLGSHSPRRLPTHLTELHDLYRSRFSLRPAPRPHRRTPTTRPGAEGRRGALESHLREHLSEAPQTQAHPREGYGLRYAPQVPDSVQATPRDRIPHPAWLRVIDDATFNGFRLVLPGCCGDLDSWSGVLRNCLNTYTRAALSGRSHLIGVEHNDRLRYIVELTPERRIRQFAGLANRMPSAQHHDTVVEFLTRHQIVR